jgi:ElaB/YqjD/DUF883 family membrane-anchored ribosome-binding protein
MDSREEKNISGDGHVAIHDWEPVDSFGQYKASSEIENDINQTRHTMDVLFDSLTERLHPRAMVDHLLDRFQLPENRKKVQDVFLNAGKKISDSFQENPIPLLLIGAGVAWIFLGNHRIPAEETERGSVKDKIRDSFGNASQTAKERFENVRNTIKDRGEKVKDSFYEGKEKAAQSFQDATGRGKEAAENAREQYSQSRAQGNSWQQRVSEQYSNTGNSVANLIREKPLAVGLAAAMLGMAAGILFPETKTEKRTVGEAAKPVADWASEKKADVTERAKNVAGDTANTAFGKSKEEGIVSEGGAKKSNETVTNVTTQSTEKDKTEAWNTSKNIVSPEKDKTEALNASKNVVSPGIENAEVNLKEKTDAKNSRKDLPDKPKGNLK